MTIHLKSLVFIIGLAFISLSVFAEEERQFTRHESREAGYAIDLPLDWDLKASIKGWDCVAFAPKPSTPDKYLDSVSVSISNGKDPAEAANAMTDSMKARYPASFTLVSEGKLKLAGCDAVKIECSYESDGVRVRSIAVFVVKGERLWTITMSAELRRFIARKELFDKVEASFQPL